MYIINKKGYGSKLIPGGLGDVAVAQWVGGLADVPQWTWDVTKRMVKLKTYAINVLLVISICIVFLHCIFLILWFSFV